MTESGMQPFATHIPFEQIKQIDLNNHIEYWLARDMAKILGYAEYRNFLPVIERAKQACLNSNQQIPNHFVDLH